MVRAKFVVKCISEYPYGKEVELECRYDTTIPEDKLFCDATPYGAIKMGILNERALDQFKIGKAFYVDFAEVEE